MNNRTPPALSPTASAHGDLPSMEKGSADLSEDGLDLRRFSQLSPLEQLDRLEADSSAVNRREKAMRVAESLLESLEVKS